MIDFKTVDFKDGKVVLIDQSRLPLEEKFIVCEDYLEVAEAIKTMKVRGAPVIGVAAALGIAQGVINSNAQDVDDLFGDLEAISRAMARTRPTAVNLFWAINRMKDRAESARGLSVDKIKQALEDEAVKIMAEDEQVCHEMGQVGSVLIEDGDSILTHCNAGALATVSYGTALGVIRTAWGQGKKIKVYVDETRPQLQGARLTAWELQKDEIPVVLITDSTAGSLMSRGTIRKVITGADRIAANGDAANKIGTYSLAILAKEHKIPFYVAAPLSTIDLSLSSGDEIPIEERDANEVTHFGDCQVAPEKVEVVNPAFDVTPAKYITAIITEKGIIKPPFKDSLKRLKLERKEKSQ